MKSDTCNCEDGKTFAKAMDAMEATILIWSILLHIYVRLCLQEFI